MQDAGSSSCPTPGAPTVLARVASPAIVEASGLAASLRFEGVFWTHNDSGDSARIFALTRTGTVAAEIALEGVTATDIEDIAVAPCAEGSCIFVADTGDNGEGRSEVAIHRLPEPHTLTSGTARVSTIRFHYEDRPHNAESLLADPTGELYVLTKEKLGPSTLFAVPTSGDVAHAVAKITPPLGSNLFTAASVARDGTMVALRTYTHAFLYPVLPDESLSVALQRPPCVVPPPGEPQGEAVAFTPDRSALLFLSEGNAVPLYEVSLTSSSR